MNRWLAVSLCAALIAIPVVVGTAPLPPNETRLQAVLMGLFLDAFFFIGCAGVWKLVKGRAIPRPWVVAGSLIAIVGGVTLFSAPTLLLIQGVLWLRDGQWTSVPLVRGWTWVGYSYPVVQWVGLQRILDSIMEAPLSLGLLLLGPMLIWAGVSMASASMD